VNLAADVNRFYIVQALSACNMPYQTCNVSHACHTHAHAHTHTHNTVPCAAGTGRTCMGAKQRRCSEISALIRAHKLRWHESS
jgi:hypothetical protein